MTLTYSALSTSLVLLAASAYTAPPPLPLLPYQPGDGQQVAPPRGGMTLGELLLPPSSGLEGVVVRVGGQHVVADELQLGADDTGRLMFAWIRYKDENGLTKTLDYRTRAATLFNDPSAISGVMIIGTSGLPFWAEAPVFGLNPAGELAFLSANGLKEFGGVSGVSLAAIPPLCTNATAKLECIPASDNGCVNDACDNKCERKEALEGGVTYVYCECNLSSNGGCVPLYTLTCPATGCNSPESCQPKLSESGKCHCL